MAIEFGPAERRGALQGTVIGLALIGLLIAGPRAIDWARAQLADPVPTPTEESAAGAEDEPTLDESAPAPTPTLTEPTPAATPTTVAPTEAEPTATATPVPGTTAIFNGGPATGPWQQIGSVSEMQHPDADPTAGYAYRNFWADPEEENQSDELWDRLVAEVAPQVLAAGEPLDRPVFGAADETEGFNSFGGIYRVHPESRTFTAGWSAWVVGQDGRAADHTWLFAIDFDTEEVVARRKLVVFEDQLAGHGDADRRQGAAVEEWARELGLGPCIDC